MAKDKEMITLSQDELMKLIRTQVIEATEQTKLAKLQVDDGKVPTIPKARIEAELSRRPQDDLFWVFGVYNTKSGKITDARKWSEPNTGFTHDVDAFQYEFNKWFGLGADILDDKGKPKYLIGRFKVAESKNVALTPESVGGLYLGPAFQEEAKDGSLSLNIHREGDYKIVDIVKVVTMLGEKHLYDGKTWPIPNGKWMTDETYLRCMKNEYSAEWAKRSAEDDARKNWDLSNSAERRLGRPSGVLAGAGA